MGSISLKELLHQAPYNKDSRSEDHPPEKHLLDNATVLIIRVNKLLRHWSDKVQVSSGYRPQQYNVKAGGATKSAHATCEAVDIRDPDNKLDQFITDNPWLLERYDLYREDPSATLGWTHLTTRAPKSKKRTFMP